MRFHYLDFSRTVLFGLGLIIHASGYFNDQYRGFAVIQNVIHNFRMKSFFVIAGFFAAMMLTKLPVRDFFRKRLLQLGIPLFFCGITFNTLLNLADPQGGVPANLLDPSYWWGGYFLRHLWFLGTLIAYVSLLAGVHLLWPNLGATIKRSRWSLSSIFLFLTLMSFVAMRIGWHIPAPHGAWLFIRFDVFLEHTGFFVVGYLFYHRQDLFEELMRAKWFNLASVLGFWCLTPFLKHWAFGEYLAELWYTVYALNVTGLLFGVAKTFFNTGNPTIRSLSDASYTVYLLHYPILGLLSLVIVPTHWPIGIRFAVLVIVPGVLSFMIHRLVVEKSALAALLINGRTGPRNFFRASDPGLGPVPIAPALHREG